MLTNPIETNRPLPDLWVRTADGAHTTVSMYLGKQGTLLNFIHGTWCAACVDQLYSLRRHKNEILATGAQIVVIMADAPEQVAAFQLAAQPPLDYTVVADPDGAAHQQAEVGDGTAIVIVDAQSIVRYFAIWHDHRNRPSYQAVLQTLQDLYDWNKS